MTTKFRIVREDLVGGEKTWVCLEHYDKAFPAQTSKELHEELNRHQRYEVQAVYEDPCELCGGKNGRSS